MAQYFLPGGYPNPDPHHISPEEEARMVQNRIVEAVEEWPVQSPLVRRQLVRHDICPECSGDLDTGWECNRCGYDAMPIAHSDPLYGRSI